MNDLLNHTARAKEKNRKAVAMPNFYDDDSQIIFKHLKNEMRYIPFGDFLKRYIYEKERMKEKYEDIDNKEFQQIILKRFKENGVEQNLLETSTKLSAMASNWLTQFSCSRQVVLWLGFGLNMTVDDCSMFLMKALREQDFNFKNPVEIIYWYCLKNEYKFSKAHELKTRYDELPTAEDGIDFFNKTAGIRIRLSTVKSDESLLTYLSNFKIDYRECTYSVTAQEHFESLYKQCQALVAGINNRMEDDRQEIELYENKARSPKKVWTAESIDENDIDRMLCSEMPRKKDGHLDKISLSHLSKVFMNKRLTGDRIRGILQKRTAVDRFDLCTLNFLLFAENESYTDNKIRHDAYLIDTNRILIECSMDELYEANPYESFLLLCLLSDYPLATYNDVWAESFKR